MARRKLDDAGVANLKVKSKRWVKPDPELPGHYIRINPTGKKTFVAVTLDINGKQVWKTIGAVPMKIGAARAAAREVIGRIRSGEDAAGPQSFETVANDWFERVVKKQGHRAERYVRQYLDNHILPAWSGRDFEKIHRGDIAKLLDKIEDAVGPSAADKILNVISRICSWHASRHPKYTSPIVRGMRRVSTKEQARDRILDDDEIRAIWKTAEANGQFGAFIRLLLLTGQRREKVAAMRWDDVSVDGVWSIPTEPREKGNAGRLKLGSAAAEIIQSRPRLDGNPYVFAGARVGKDGKPGHFSGYSKMKASFDKRLAEVGVRPAPWRLHDLRRTARSLLSRAGVSSEHGERVLGHAIRGVEGTYDRHRYEQEIAAALLKLEGLITLILNPPADNVVRIAG